MSESGVLDQARILAGNLAAEWNGARDVLRGLVAAAGDSALSPWAALNRLGPAGVESLFAGSRREALEAAVRELTRYLASPTWFDRASERDADLAVLRTRPIAYFCMEYGFASWLPIYSGGLGVLAGDMLKEASDMGLPLVAVGLFYRHGFFYQQLDSSHYQTETIPHLNPAELPLEPVEHANGAPLLVSVPFDGRSIYAAAWKLRVGRVALYLLDTDVPENEREEDRSITASLYGGGHETRIRQEIILGIGGTRLLAALGIDPAVYSLNEGHAAFLGLELLASNLHEAAWQTALRQTRQRVVYTNHTVVPAGNDVFSCALVRSSLGSYAEQSGIGIDNLLSLASAGDTFSMAVLAFQLSGKANAVSELHARVIPREWPGFEVEAVTNGVHVPTWIGSPLAAVLDECVPDWRGDSPDWSRIHDIPDERLMSARREQRGAMIDFVNRVQPVQLDESALTIVWARRFAEYKRAWLIASDLGRLARILGSPSQPVQVVISGKSHPHDEGGKRMLQELLRRLEEDGAVAARVAFVPDYNVQVARALTQGADVWLNTPRKPLEASGTSGMKSSDNGGLQLTVTDGWAAEVDWYRVGWGIAGIDDQTDARQLYDYLEGSIVPSFYARDAEGISHEWAAMMKNTMVITLSRYSTRRMVLDYVYKLYLPLLGQQQAVGRKV